MVSRISFLLIAVFWVTMNFLLWRSEFSGQKKTGSAVSADTVLEKILTAPDTSALEIYHHGKKIGFCRWAADVGVEAGKKNFADDFQPEGMFGKPANYTLNLEGNVTPEDSTNRLRFELTLKLSTNRVWETFVLRAHMRPDSWELHADSVQQTVKFVIDDSLDRWEQTFTFADLQNPQTLLRELGGPGALSVMSMLGSIGLAPSPTTNAPRPKLNLKWQANNDSMRFGHSKVRVYRLHTKIMERFDVFIFVSRVGEILWVELPDKIVLSNDAFTHF